MEDDFCGPDEDDDVEPSPFSKTKKRSGWLVAGAFFELIANIFEALNGFFDVLTDAALSRFTYENETAKVISAASREIEMLTSGEYDAATTESGRSIGPGTTE